MRKKLNFKNKNFRLIALFCLVLLVGLPFYISSTQVKGTRSDYTISGVWKWKNIESGKIPKAGGFPFWNGTMWINSKFDISFSNPIFGTKYNGIYYKTSHLSSKDDTGSVWYMVNDDSGHMILGDCNWYNYNDSSFYFNGSHQYKACNGNLPLGYAYMDFGDGATLSGGGSYRRGLGGLFRKEYEIDKFWPWFTNNIEEVKKACYKANGSKKWEYFFSRPGSVATGDSEFMCHNGSSGGSSTTTSYTIKYDANGGTSAPSSQTKKKDTTLTLTTSKPKNGSYVFKEWNTKSDGSGTSYSSGGSYTSNSDATLFAQWKSKVEYDANGGTVTPTSEDIDFGKSATLPTPTRENYNFLGWYTMASGGGGVSSPYTPSGSIKLYAHWAIITYKVTYDANGGSVSPTSTNVNAGSSIGTLPTPTRSNYEFLGWYLTPEGSGANQITASYKPSGDVTVYARWKKIHTITYNANGGTVNPTSVNVKDGNEIGTLPTPTRTKYAFKGWFTSSNGGTQVTSTYKPNGDMTIYAHWNEILTITYNTAGGNNLNSKTIEKGEELGTLPIPEKEGYKFLGWYAAAVGGSTITSSYKPSSDITIYAHWKDPITVTYDPNGGEVNPTSTEVVEGGSISSFPTPSKTGYIFKGWYTEKNGGIAINAPYKPAKAITLYAHWEAQKEGTYVITYNANGGEKAPENTVYLKGDSGSITLKYPRRTGWKFIGWNTKADGSGDNPVRGSTVNDTNLTLYAQWEKVDQDSICGVRRNPETSDKEMAVIVLLAMSVIGYLYSYFIMKKAKQ